MNHTTGSKSFFLKIRENSSGKTLGFGEIGVSQTGRFVGISLANMLDRQTHRKHSARSKASVSYLRYIFHKSLAEY